MKKKLYEFETQRTGISPRQFFSWCKREFKRRTGEDFGWIDGYKNWAEPTAPCNIKTNHEDWEEPLKEICKLQPMDYQYYLEGAYNFIMEYDDGNGYCYIVEFER